MGRTKNRAIAQKSTVKQQKSNIKPKAVKTNLKRLNERLRDNVKQVDKLYEDQTKTQEGMDTVKQDPKPAATSTTAVAAKAK
ncbi:unnamed protein product [Adineta steineri]|uniref:Uncharacterized protein n=1 Tax=Adineta steineri TaxID=433720 RepID=A0A819HKC9_9BILA|nr:unnamed protein product [Adineta steineri]CAF1432490.1 unnamed protein product [Adineta steineri]CAF3871143.1 unnamed protein product [Adineta steineri]CAF3903452.1 unnamed protein product [Adineta steineri]